MNDIITQNEKRQLECNRRANELYKKLSVAGDNATSMINDLNNQKLRIFIAKVKLFIKKLQGEETPHTNSSVANKPKQSFFDNFKEIFGTKNKIVDNAKQVTKNIGTKKYAITLVLVCIPYTGCLGIHDFYLGKTMLGIIKLCTGNFFTIGWIIDILRVVTKNYTDSYGNKLQ